MGNFTVPRALRGSLVALLVAGALVVGDEREADACGACFSSANESTIVSDHKMALAITKQQTILWDQITYTGNPSAFAYVIPARQGTRVEASTDPWFQALDASSIYAVPLQYHAEGLDAEVLHHFGLTSPLPDLGRWEDIVDRYQHPEGEVTIGVVGKYVGLPDAYKSLNEALVHGGMANRVKVNIKWIDAELFEEGDEEIVTRLEPMHGILVPGGFGVRGTEGKIASVRFARELKGGMVFAVDLEPNMVKHMAERAKAAGIGNLHAVTARAESVA